MTTGVTRLAPSPTGALHLGNARTFLINYLLARQLDWRVIMRVEDLDGPRVKQGAARSALADLEWLGLTWDGPVVYQSQRHGLYEAALARLARSAAAYPCVCSRKDIDEAASAPHANSGIQRYPGTCRGLFASPQEARAKTGRPVAWRVITDDVPITFADQFHGPCEFNLAQVCGDFVIFRGSGLAAYQLAVVLDDDEADVDCIVRGNDLLDSAARQIHLRRLLRPNEAPKDEVRYWHVPLVVGTDGRRLAKRHGDTRLDYYRKLGATAQRVLGLLGYWCGALDERRELTMAELVEMFDIDQMAKQPAVFTPEDDAYLRGQ